MAGQHHDLDLRVAFLDAAESFDPVHAGHANVEDDHIDVLVVDQFECFEVRWPPSRVGRPRSSSRWPRLVQEIDLIIYQEHAGSSRFIHRILHRAPRRPASTVVRGVAVDHGVRDAIEDRFEPDRFDEVVEGAEFATEPCELL